MTTTPQVLTESSEAEIQKVLMGRRIVSAEMGKVAIPPCDGIYYSEAAGVLALDDGTRLYVIPNDGCGGCSSGYYEIEHLATVDNAITNVELVSENVTDSAMFYRVHVVADALDMDVITVAGDDGNGCYGTGYTLIVLPASAQQPTNVRIDP